MVGRKFQKVSHKIAKVRCTKKEEYIILKNMHEPLVDMETWNKAQEKLNGYTKVRDRKYNHELKGFVYCAKGGNKATLRHREGKRKDGTTWQATYFICSKRNNYSGLCDCKQISAEIIEKAVKQQIRNELQKIRLSKKEIIHIYKEAEQQAKTKDNQLKIKLKMKDEKLKIIEQNIEELYNDKINKVIEIQDFKVIYEKMQIKKSKITEEIAQTQEFLNKKEERCYTLDYNKIKQISTNLLQMETVNKVMLEQLIQRIEFDGQRNIKIKMLFKNPVEKV